MMTKRSVAILYGFGEGRRRGRELQAALTAAGFAHVDTPDDADIVIAHSGGMYGLPANVTGKLVVLVAPSCGNPDWTWLQTQSRKVWLDMKYFWGKKMFIRWLAKSWWNFIYLVGQIPRLRELWRIHQQHQRGLPRIDTQVVVIAFKDDPWSGYISATERAKHPSYVFVDRDATHDDLWIHPEYYVELVRSLMVKSD